MHASAMSSELLLSHVRSAWSTTNSGQKWTITINMDNIKQWTKMTISHSQCVRAADTAVVGRISSVILYF